MYMFLKQEKPEMDDLERRRKTLGSKGKILIFFTHCIKICNYRDKSQLTKHKIKNFI